MPGLYFANLKQTCRWTVTDKQGRQIRDRVPTGYYAYIGSDRPAVVIRATDQTFESSGCVLWRPYRVRSEGEPRSRRGYHFRDGIKYVGSDVWPGTYVLSEQHVTGCYWSRYAGLEPDAHKYADHSGDFVTSAPSIVTISADDHVFFSHLCGHWYAWTELFRIKEEGFAAIIRWSALRASRLQHQVAGRFDRNSYGIPQNPRFDFIANESGNATSIRGRYVVRAGRYYTRGLAGRTCYWWRLRSFTGESRDVIESGHGISSYVTIGADDVGFRSANCGRFQWSPAKGDG